MNKVFHYRETITLIKGAVFLGVLQMFGAEIKEILLAIASLVK